MQEKVKSSVVAVIWSFNPNIRRFMKVLQSAVTQVNHVIVVDNGSNNVDQVRKICNNFKNVTLIETGRNLGVRALNIGMKEAVAKFKPDFILLLDDDTILYPGAIAICMNTLSNSRFRDLIGVLCLSPWTQAKGEGQIVIFQRGGILSGNLIRSELVKSGFMLREDFFLDQADFDFYEEIRRSGFITALYNKKLINHKLGILLPTLRIRLPLIGKINVYEPLWRYYYIVRNSTVLLIEGKLDIAFYLVQLLRLAFPLLLVDGFLKTFKVFILGLTHGIFRKLGILIHKI